MWCGKGTSRLSHTTSIQVLRGCALRRPASACERWQQYRYCVAAPCGGPRVPASVGNNTGIAWLRLAAARECLRALATIQVLRGCALRRPASACERWQQYRYCVAAPCGGPRVPASVGNNTGIAWLRLAAARECLRALATIQVLRGCALWRPASACERWQQYRYCVAAPCGGPQVPASVGNNTGIARRSRTIARKRLRALATIQVLRGGAARLPASA